MHTQCPRCQAFTEIDDETLQRSRRMVVCPHCSVRFYALRRHSDAPAPVDPGGQPDAAPQAPTAAGEGAGSNSGMLFGNPALQAPTSVQSGDEWLAHLPTNLAAALIAEAAGIPRGAQHEEGVWTVTADAPDPAASAGPAVSPVTPAEDPAGDPGNGNLPVKREDIAPTGPMATDGPDGEFPGPPAGTPADTLSESPVVAESGPIASDPAEVTVADTQDRSGAPDASVDTPGPTSADPVPAPVPVYVRPPRRWTSRASLSWALGCLLLALLLAAQVAWIKRVSLYNNPHTRPWVAQVCNHLPCHLPPIRDITKLQLLSRAVRPDPDRGGALMITATVRNNAHFAQPWPTVTVELSDLGGNPVAMRRFRPDRYMPNPARRAAGIAAGATAVVAFEVADPGKRAVSFRFGFR